MDSTFVSLAKDLAIFAKDTFNNIAPDAWTIARQSVYADIASDIIVFLSCVIATFVLAKLCKICLEKQENGGSYNDWNIVVVFVVMGMIISSVTSMIALGLIVQRAIAIDYYTLLKIVSLVK